MKNYRWKNSANSGCIEADNRAHAKVKLLLQNIKAEKIWRDYRTDWLKYRSQKDIELNLLQQLSLILPSNIPLEKALTILNQQDNHEIKLLSHKILTAIRKGSSLSLALGKNTTLPRHYLEMLSLAEQQGTVVTTLEKIYLRIETHKQIKAHIKKATFYPLLLLFTCLSVCIIMIYYLLPNLQEFYLSNHAVLPKTTQFLLHLSSLSFIQICLPLILLLALFWLILTILRQEKYKAHYHKFLLKLPGIGKLIYYYQLASIFSLMDESLSSGFNLHSTWIQIIPTISNRYFQDKMKKSCTALETGHSFYQSLLCIKLFPSLAMSLFMIAEDTGQYPHMTNKLANIYEKIFQDQLHKTLRWLEPLLLFLMTGLIGFIVISVYSPLFSIGNVM